MSTNLILYAMYLRQKENKGKNINNRAESCYCQKKRNGEDAQYVNSSGSNSAALLPLLYFTLS